MEAGALAAACLLGLTRPLSAGAADADAAKANAIAKEMRLTAIRPFGGAQDFTPGKMALSVDQNLQPGILESPSWSYGWRDEGTSDTRPRLKRAQGAYNGRDAVSMEIWYPNSAESVDYWLGGALSPSDT